MLKNEEGKINSFLSSTSAESIVRIVIIYFQPAPDDYANTFTFDILEKNVYKHE